VRDEIDRTDFVLTDADEVHEAFRAIYGGRATDDGDTSDARFEMHAAQAGGLTVERVVHNMRCSADFEPDDRLLITSVLGGQLDIEAVGEQGRPEIGEAVLSPADEPWRSSWSAFSCATVRLPASAVATVAQSRYGVPSGRFRFSGVSAVTPEMNRAWTSLNRFVHSQFAERTELVANPLLRPLLMDYIASTAISVFPNTTMTTAYRPGPGQAGPSTLRRAIDWIESHPDAPMTIETIAEHAGAGARALQLAFRRHLNTTPMGYVRLVRLQAAHRDLLAGDPGRGDTVAGIAGRWGFRRTDRFAAVYRAEFGETPQKTLHR
jgi:AraC-like DNA-binding protein